MLDAPVFGRYEADAADRRHQATRGAVSGAAPVIAHRKLGIPEQQVQRFEQTRYRGAANERLQEATDAVGVTLSKTAE